MEAPRLRGGAARHPHMERTNAMEHALATLAKLAPMERGGRAIAEVVAELNRTIRDAGVEFGDGGFDVCHLEGAEAPSAFGTERWVEVSTVRGSSEGWYVHVRMVVANSATGSMECHLVSMAKAWKRASAFAIQCAATSILDA